MERVNLSEVEEQGRVFINNAMQPDGTRYHPGVYEDAQSMFAGFIQRFKAIKKQRLAAEINQLKVNNPLYEKTPAYEIFANALKDVLSSFFDKEHADAYEGVDPQLLGPRIAHMRKIFNGGLSSVRFCSELEMGEQALINIEKGEKPQENHGNVRKILQYFGYDSARQFMQETEKLPEAPKRRAGGNFNGRVNRREPPREKFR